MRIVLIGSGNVASVFGRKLHAAGHQITAVYSKRPERAAVLAAELDAKTVFAVSQLPGDTDAFLIAISDDALHSIKGWNFTTDKLVIHTAGSVSKEVLASLSPNYGVLYPLQSLRQDAEPAGEIPLLIDGNSEQAKSGIIQLARSISSNVTEADDHQRKMLHLAAVIVNNFPNHLYTLTEEFCKSEGADFTLLLPLITEGTMRMRNQSPATLQTGPAARGDSSTIHVQQELLVKYPQLAAIYSLFTESIIQKNRSSREGGSAI